MRRARVALRLDVGGARRPAAAALLADAILEAPEAIAHVRVLTALDWLPSVGPRRARRLLRDMRIYGARIDEDERVGRLDDRQAHALVAAVRTWGASYGGRLVEHHETALAHG